MLPPTSPPLKVGFLGAGQMAAALARGWLAAGLVAPATCRASDPYPAARARFQDETGCPAAADNTLTNNPLTAARDRLIHTRWPLWNGRCAELTPGSP